MLYHFEIRLTTNQIRYLDAVHVVDHNVEHLRITVFEDNLPLVVTPPFQLGSKERGGPINTCVKLVLLY